jgi:hemoglobin
MANDDRTVTSLFDRAGGMPFFSALVERFYAGVANDPVLRPLYPEADLGPAARRLTLFLAQFWGGPATYSQERGHPRLRMRHAPFSIGSDERDRWLRHMGAAVAASDADEGMAAEMMGYFTTAAEAMRNRPR